jgi:hypothetical protein
MKTILVSFMVALLLCIVACNNEPPPPVLCLCPEGTLHLAEETCCEGEDCECQEAYAKIGNIFVTMGAGVADPVAQKAKIQKAVEYLEEDAEYDVWSVDILNTIKTKVYEIRVLPGTGATTKDSTLAGDKYVILMYANTSASDLYGAFYTLAPTLTHIPTNNAIKLAKFVDYNHRKV